MLIFSSAYALSVTLANIPRVCMIIMQSPQFPTQDNNGLGDGIAPIPQWYEAAVNILTATPTVLDAPFLDPEIMDILCRLHNLFDSSQYTLVSTDLHDLTCYVVHKLLLWSPQPLAGPIPCDLVASSIVRHALVLYLLIVHGPTYFSHAQLQYATALKLQAQIEHTWYNMLTHHGSLALWLLSVGMVASEGTPESQWFATQARTAAVTLNLQTWIDIVVRLQDIVWLDSQTAELLFQRKWQEVWAMTPT